MTESVSELKPCPFCGESVAMTAEASSLNKGGVAYHVACRTRGCHGVIFALGFHLFETPEQAATAWNTRTPAPGDVESAQAEREAIIAWLRGLHWTHRQKEAADFFATAIEQGAHHAG